MDHGRFHELAAGDVLEDLDRDERIIFDAHRAGCRSCGALVEDLLEVGADLATLAPARAAPDGLASSVLAMIRADASTGPARHAVTGWRKALRRPRGRPWIAHRILDLGVVGLAAVLAVVAIGLASRNADLTRAVSESSATVQLAQDRLATQSLAMAVAADPAHREVALQPEALAPAASAVVMYVPGTTAAYLMASGLPPTPAGHVYQLWVADAKGAHGLGTYAFDGRGPFVVPLGVDLGGAAATMITLEPDGGAHGEPGPQVVFGNL